MASSQTQRIGILKVCTGLILSASLWLALFAVAPAEVIRSFDSKILVADDGTLTVTETIDYDFEGASRHGIYRNIPDKHMQPASDCYKYRYVDFELLSVTRDGVSEPYSQNGDDGLSVRIGDTDSVITGLHQYKITYRARGALASYPDSTELYWNVTGHEWEVPMQEVSASIIVGQNVGLGNEGWCYVGLPGGNSKCASISRDGSIVSFVEKSLSPGTELTIAQSLALPATPLVLERVVSVWLWLIVLLLWFGGLGVWIYRWRTKLKPDLPVIARYEPYEDFKPMFTGVLFDNRLDSRDITAGIIYLAQQGFISIKQTTDKVFWLFETNDYEISLLKSKNDAQKAYQKELLSLIFHKPTSFLKELKENLGLMSEAKSFRLSSGGQTSYEEQEVTIVKLSEIKGNNNAARANYKTIQRLKATVKNDLVQRGFLEKKANKSLSVVVIFLFVFLVFGETIYNFLGGLSTFISVIIISSFISFLIFFTFGLSRRTKKGYEALNHLKGFKDFLSTTEKDRYKFHNAPSLSPQQFMEYLPYAIAFGVEKEWAEVFEGIIIDAPDWYSSSTGASFSAAAFTADIGSFATAFASSGASGASGSSGGGSAGGGSGGGGGGSW